MKGRCLLLAVVSIGVVVAEEPCRPIDGLEPLLRAGNVLLLGEATFHQFHGGAATANTGYFSDSLQEHENATGTKYLRPEFNFLADLGVEFQRLQKISQHLKN